MSKYFISQFKRQLRVFPAILLVAALLFGGLYLAYTGLVWQWNQSADFQKVNIALVGTADDRYLELGFQAVQSMDSSKFTINFSQMDQEQANRALESGKIDAYIYFPPEFVDNARMGIIMPLHFVSAAGSENLLSLVKEELTVAIDDLLLASERASFGIYDALEDFDEPEMAQSRRDELALRCAALTLNRHTVYKTEVLGVADGQSFQNYMLCGILTLFLFLITLPFVCILVRQDMAMEKHLKSRGIGIVQQVLCELAAYFVSLLTLVLVLLAVLSRLTVENLLIVVPAVLALTALSYFIYGLAGDVITGLLLQFITVIAFCFVSGCMYPVHFFPVSVQQIGAWMPPSLVKSCLSGVLYGTKCDTAIKSLLAISITVIALSVLVRYIRLNGGRRARV